MPTAEVLCLLSAWMTDTSHHGLLRSIICGCPGWQTVDMLDDDTDFRTSTMHVPGCTLRADVVYARRDGLWRLSSLCITLDERWAVDYGFSTMGFEPTLRLCEYVPGEPWMTVRPLQGLQELPLYYGQLLQALHPYFLKLALVATVLPIRSPRAEPAHPVLVPAAAPHSRAGRPPRPPPRACDV